MLSKTTLSAGNWIWQVMLVLIRNCDPNGFGLTAKSDFNECSGRKVLPGFEIDWPESNELIAGSNISETVTSTAESWMTISHNKAARARRLHCYTCHELGTRRSKGVLIARFQVCPAVNKDCVLVTGPDFMCAIA
ncbi:hypothetical protein [Roseovarius indicus]|uniref:hypothetical protein n=1 Tax=Roseovarius indicus TaxID=540747 RepID=UPI0035148781